VWKETEVSGGGATLSGGAEDGEAVEEFDEAAAVAMGQRRER
jgi:hypothetical protein